MKKFIILLLTFLLFSNLFAEGINEYKSDIYFANGVGAKSPLKSKRQGQIQYMEYLDSNLDMEKHMGKYDLAFNTGHGVILDYFEAFLQYSDENPGMAITWSAFTSSIGRIPIVGNVLGAVIGLTEAVTRSIENSDITKQVEAYRQSIYAGHKVVVIAHSQGNFFTNKAYKAFNNNKDKWMQKLFVTVGLASPSSKIIPNSSYMTYDNDPVEVLGGAGNSLSNPNRYYQWTYSSNLPVPGICESIIVPKDEVPTCSYDGWILQDNSHDNFHVFDYYMDTVKTKSQVYSFLTNAVLEHLTAKSQWKLKELTQCTVSGCENKIREGEHEYDASLNYLLGGSLVYPFNEDGKLYGGIDDTYVKASYGGESINEPLDKNVCYELKNKDGGIIDTIDSKFEGASKTPQNGYIEVTLAWPDKAIDMDLKVSLPNGEHDIKDIPCQPLEHFFAKDDTGLSPGVYPVHVTYTDDANISEEVKGYPNIIVSIKVPGGTEIRNVSFKTIGSLANGHIADIVVEENEIKYVPTDDFKQQTTVIYNSYNSGYSSNVGGGSSSSYGGSSGGTYNGGNQYSGSWTIPTPHFDNEKDYIYYILWHISKADLGALAGADVSIYKATDFDVGNDTGVNPIWQSQTTYGSTVHTAGIIAWDRDIINTLEDDKVYVVKVDGGTDIDVNDDTVVDSIPTTNLGAIHALVTGHELKNIGLKVNVISELAYQIAKDKLHSDTTTVMTRADEASKCLIKKDFNMDGEINHIDGLLWSPYKDKGTVIRNYNSNFTPIISKIHNAQPIYEEAYNLFAQPMIEGFNTTIREDSGSGSIVGQIKSYCTSESVISEYIITGTGAQNFEVDSNGTMKVSSSASFVYENKRIYDLHVRGKNAFGSSQSVQVYVEIAADGSPILGGSVSTFVIENMSAGTVRGSIGIDDRGNPITKVRLVGNGAENFDISLNGSISVSSNASINKSDGTYYLKAIATNAIGDSAPVSVTIKIYDDVPVLNGLTSKIYNNTPIGTIIGKLSYTQGLSSINSFSLSGIGSENFDISSSGEISVAQNANIGLENAPYYLQATGTNNSGTSNAVSVTIRVIEPPKPSDPPSEGIYVGNFSSFLYFSVANGKSVGKVSYSYNLNPPNSFRLEGEQSTPFSINNSGHISVLDASLLRDKIGNTFTFKVIASNDYISGSEATVSISIVDDVPSISNFSTSIVEGSYTNAIGKVGYSYGMNPIKSFSLSGDGASDFSISNSGYIYVADGVSLTYSRQSSYALTVTGVNTIERSSSASVNISIIDDAPVLKSTTMSILENSAPTEVVGKVQIASHGKSRITSFELSGDNSSSFEIDSKGYIRVASGAILDYEAKPTYTLISKASNDYDTSNQVSVIVNLKNISDGEPILLHNTISIKENAISGVSLGTINIKDAGVSAIESFTISGTDSDKFEIDANGVFKVTANNLLDYETKKVYNLIMSATNGYGISNTANLIVKIEDIPDVVPIIISPLSMSITENNVLDALLGKLNIHIGDSPITSVTITGKGSISFRADNEGNIYVSNSLNYEDGNLYTLFITATNLAGSSNQVELNVNVLNVLDDEPELQDTTLHVLENSTGESILGKVNIKSIGTAPIEYFTIEGKNKEFFSVTPEGNLILSKDVVLDYESDVKLYSYTLRAYNYSGRGISQPVKLDIEIDNVPEFAPTIEGFSITIPENNEVGVYLGTLKIIDSGDTNITGYKVTEGDKNLITINEIGEVYANASYNYESFIYNPNAPIHLTQYGFNVVASNLAGDSEDESSGISINITDVDEIAPLLITTFPQKTIAGVPIYTIIQAEFDENISSPDIAIIVRDTISEEAINGSISISEKTITFLPDSPLKFDTTYEVSLNSFITDLIGNSYEGSKFTFVTSSKLLPKPTADFRFDGNLLDTTGNHIASGGVYSFLNKDERTYIKHNLGYYNPIMTNIPYAFPLRKRSYRFIAKADEYNTRNYGFIFGGNTVYINKDLTIESTWFVNLYYESQYIAIGNNNLSEEKIDANKWHDFVINIDHNTGQYELFIDGTLSNTGIDDRFKRIKWGSGDNNLQLLAFRSFNSDFAAPIEGLDIFQVYDRFLLAEEVEELFYHQPTDEILPTLISTSPTNSSTNISTDTSIYIKFDEAMNYEQGIISVRDITNNIVVDGNISVDEENIQFKPKNRLRGDALIEVVLSPYIKDLAGNMYEGSSFTFRTQTEYTGLIPEPIADFRFNGDLLDQIGNFSLSGKNNQFKTEDNRTFVNAYTGRTDPITSNIPYKNLRQSYRFVIKNVEDTPNNYIFGGTCNDLTNCQSWFINSDLNGTVLAIAKETINHDQTRNNKWNDYILNVDHKTGEYQVFMNGRLRGEGNNTSLKKGEDEDNIQLLSFNDNNEDIVGTIYGLDLFQVYGRFLLSEEVFHMYYKVPIHDGYAYVYALNPAHPSGNINYSGNKIRVYRLKVDPFTMKVVSGSILGTLGSFTNQPSLYTMWYSTSNRPVNGYSVYWLHQKTVFNGLSERYMYPSFSLRELAKKVTYDTKMASNYSGGNLNRNDNFWTNFSPKSGLPAAILSFEPH